MRYWLVKSEADVYSLDDLKRDKKTHWHGVRNYQARNYLKDMKKGDRVAYYHSNCDIPGIVGTAVVVKEAYPDPSQFEVGGEYYDEKATTSEPRWYCPDIKFEGTFAHLVSLEILKELPVFKDAPLVKRGNRLSVLPLTGAQFAAIERTGRKQGAK